MDQNEAEMLRELRVCNIRELNRFARKGQIVLAGSSLCEMFPVNELLNAEEKRYTVYNRGISGDTTDRYLENLEDCLFALEPSKLFLNIGTNDMNTERYSYSYSEDCLMANCGKILAQVAQRLLETKTFLLSYYPVNAKAAARLRPGDASLAMFNTRCNPAIISANRRLQGLAEEYGCTFIDLYPVLLDAQGDLDEAYTFEGIHLKPGAYRLILDRLLPYFDA